MPQSATRSANQVTLLRAGFMPKDLAMYNIDLFSPDDVERLLGALAARATFVSYLPPA